MTCQTQSTCPECGAAYKEGIAINFFECGSSDPKTPLLHAHFWQSDRCRIASITRQLAERDEELRLVMADNLTLISAIEQIVSVAADESRDAEKDSRYGDMDFWDAQSDMLNEILAKPHPGQPLLDKLAERDSQIERLERVAEAARGILKAIEEASLYNDQPSTAACDELENALTAIESKGTT